MLSFYISLFQKPNPGMTSQHLPDFLFGHLMLPGKLIQDVGDQDNISDFQRSRPLIIGMMLL